MYLWTSSTKQFSKMFPESHIATSAMIQSKPKTALRFFGPEFLNSLREPGIPPHELILKKGAICQLTRNFDAFRFDEVFSILWVLSLLFVRETKGRTLEELNQVFALSMRAHAAYGLRQVPYGFRKFC
jgi:hypothetical protein